MVYTGTHDNDTTAGWFEKLSDGDKEVALRYMNSFYTPKEEQHWDLIALAMRSTADTCIIPVRIFWDLEVRQESICRPRLETTGNGE